MTHNYMSIYHPYFSWESVKFGILSQSGITVRFATALLNEELFFFSEGGEEEGVGG